MTKELAIASAEINEILQYLTEEQVEKIPIKLRKFFKKIAKKDYRPYIDPNKSILEQNISSKTKDILVIFYRNYWSDKEKRIEIDRILMENERKYQEELSQKYNVNNIFKSDNITSDNNKIEIKNEDKNELIVAQNESIFIKIINKLKEQLKNILYRNK